jgi:enoyl-CoA hydratase/carnithine racemase
MGQNSRTYDNILYDKSGEVATITLNRPDKMNALSLGPGGLLEEWADACADARADSAIRVVVIKGAGRCFSAGYDISQDFDLLGAPIDDDGYQAMADHVERYFRVLWESPKVFIAQVHGFCLAGGGDMAAFCDLTVAGDDAVFGYPAVRYGVLPTTFVWPYLIGMKKTRELAYTGNMMSATEALQHGLVNRVVPADALDRTVAELAASICAVPALTVRLTKQSVNNMFEIMGIRQAIQQSRELDLHVMSSPPAEMRQFFDIAQRDGLTAALTWRDARHAGTDHTGQNLRTRRYY